MGGSYPHGDLDVFVNGVTLADVPCGPECIEKVTPCASGYYQVITTNSVTCNACDVCVDGSYETLSCANSHNRVCAACTSIDHCDVTVECTTANDQSCSQCHFAYYWNPTTQTCAQCVRQTGCQAQSWVPDLPCLNDVQSCDACTTNYYRDPTGLCVFCTLIDNCKSASTCHNANDQVCPQCNDGYYYQASTQTCNPCTVCDTTVSFQTAQCTHTQDTMCQFCNIRTGCGTSDMVGGCSAENPFFPCATCISNHYYLHDGLCSFCAPIENCPGSTCTTSTNQVCPVCGPGYFIVGQTCQACTVCDSNSFPAPACSQQQDTVCHACRECDLTRQYESVPCGIHDRAWTTCGIPSSFNACAANSYTFSGCTAAYPYLDCTMCISSTYELHNGRCIYCSLIGNCVASIPCTATTGTTCTACTEKHTLENNNCVFTG